MGQNLFLEAVHLLESLEAHLAVPGANYRSDNFVARAFVYLMRATWFPVRLVLVGKDEKSKPFMTLSLLWFLGLLFLALVTPQIKTPIPHELIRPILYVVMFVPIGLVFFSTPSLYASHGIRASDIDFVVTHLRGRQLTAVPKVEAIQMMMTSFAERARQRIMRLWWVGGIVWGFICYGLTTTLDLVSKMKDAVEFIQMQRSFYEYALIGFCFLLWLSVVWCYEAAVTRLFKTIEFGCAHFLVELKELQSSTATAS